MSPLTIYVEREFVPYIAALSAHFPWRRRRASSCSIVKSIQLKGLGDFPLRYNQ
jgi:hypothetical protein